MNSTQYNRTQWKNYRGNYPRTNKYKNNSLGKFICMHRDEQLIHCSVNIFRTPHGVSPVNNAGIQREGCLGRRGKRKFSRKSYDYK